jgi:hypothetical protein
MHPIGIGLALGLGEGRGLAPYLGNVATRAMTWKASAFNAGLTGINTRMAHWLRDSVTSIRLVYANWHIDDTASSGAESGSGGTLQIRAALETAGGTRTQVTFGGNAQGSVASGGNLVSDEIAWSGSAGDKFYSRTQQLNAAGCAYLDQKANSAIGDRLDFDSADHTMSGTIADGLPGYCYGPVAILATTRKRTVLLVGTSRTFGFSDTPDSSGDLGELARSVGPTNGYILDGVSGNRASFFKSNYAKQLELAQYDDQATIQSDLATIYALAPLAGKRLWGITVDPKTTGAWSNADGSDQSVAINYSALNALLTAKPSPLFRTLDMAAPVALAATPTKWKAGYTADGLHANQTAELARKSAMQAAVAAALA